jgi:GAF domain-containing protein
MAHQMNSALPRVAQPLATGAAVDTGVHASERRPSTEACLQAVVRASSCLLAAPDLASGMQAAVQALQTHTGLDRVYLFADAPALKGVLLVAEAVAPDIQSIRGTFGDRVYADAEFTTVLPGLRAGRIHQLVQAERTGASAEFNAAMSTRSDLILPVFVEGHFWGAVGFDDCLNDRRWDAAEVLALQGAAAALAAAVQRDALAAAREAERQRFEALLRAVAEASQHLVSHDDLPTALILALSALRLHTDVDRVCLIRYATEEQASYFWLESMRDGLPPFVAGFGPGPWPDDDFAEVAYPLREGRVYRSTAGLRTGTNASANQTNGSLSDLIVPIMVGGQYRACLGFDDNSSPRAWTDAEVAVLQTAASAIAAALSQNEARALKAKDAEALSLRDRLLAAVAQSLQFLLGNAEADFEAAVQATLGALGQACGIHRVKVILQRVDPASAELTHFLDHEWWAPGLVSQASLGLTQFPNTSIQDWLRPMQAEQAIWRMIDDVAVPLRAAFEHVGVQSVGAVPIFGGAEYLGVVAFDDCVNKRVWSAAEIDALSAAARTVGAAIHRHALRQTMLNERDLRIAAEQARADHAQQLAARMERHSRLLAAVAASAEDLLARADPADSVDAVLARVGTVTHAERVCLARLEWTPHDLAQHGWQEIDHEWARSGVVRQMDGPLRRFAMRRGDATWDSVLKQFAAERRILSTIENLDEPFRSEQLALGVVWSLCYPVVLEGQVWGLLGMDYATPFDDYDEADLAALQTVATTIADAMLRRTLEQRALATERAHVDEAQALNLLLESVVQSSRELLDAPDFKTGLQQWLQVLAQAVDADVALLGSLSPSAEGATLADWQVHWGKSGIRPTPPVPATTDFIDWHARLLRGEAVWAHREDLLDPASVGYWQEIDCSTNLLVPVVSAGGTLGFLCFDWNKRREWQPAYGTVLRTAADSVAAAIQRHEATQALLAEREKRIATEFARAQENLRLAALMGHVVRSSRALIDTELQGFEPALRTWLGRCGDASGAIRTTFYDLVDHDPSGLRTARMLCEWVREGVGGSVPVSFAQPHVIDPRGAEPLMNQLTCGKVVAFHTDDTQAPLRTFLEQQGNATVIAVPLFVGGRQWGCLSFDHGVRKQPSPGEVAVLQTAADTLSAILRRNEATRATLAERELRIEEEQRRSADLGRANQALRASLAALAETQSEAGFVNQCLLQLNQQAGAKAAYLFGYDDLGGMLRLMGATAESQFHTAGLPGDPPMFRSGFQCDPTMRSQLMTSGRLLWRLLQSSPEPRGYAAEVQRWQTQQGYRADALHALMVGQQMVGLVALEFTDAEPPSNAQQELTHTLCQTLTLAIELARLGALARLSAERAAVLGERQRMAGEIHDSLAQSFTSIAMQSESLARRLGDEPESVHVLRLIERTAREGLAEARSSVLALLPMASAAGSLDLALTELAARSSVPGGIQCGFSSQGMPFLLGEAAREGLLRIAQEATSNAMRHSGGSQIALRLVYTGAGLLLSVDDDGHGPQRNAGLKQNGGFGMAGMQARADAVGAQLHVAVAALGGYSVGVYLPRELERSVP